MLQGQIDRDSHFVRPTESIFNAKDIECPKCFAKVGEQCFETSGTHTILFTRGPNHIERARQSRWKKMNLRHDIE